MNTATKQYLRDLTLRRDAVATFDEYPFSIPAIASLDTLNFHPDVTFLVGENGVGKSTLVEAIAVLLGLNPEGGTRNFWFSTRVSHSGLYEALELGRGGRKPRECFFLRAESFFNVATEIDRLGVEHRYGGKSLHEQSHGESFISLFMNRFGEGGVYVLDEPEAALSPVRQMSLLALMHRLVTADSQFVIATHSPILLAYPQSWIYALDERGATLVEYESTESYRVTKGSLDNPDRCLRELLR